jgi:very-short-patch-repair endonuclease
VIPRAQLNVEVDGKQHYENAHQILSDLKRSHYSDRKGWDTIHIPNAVIDNEQDLHRVADGWQLLRGNVLVSSDTACTITITSGRRDSDLC